MVRQHSLAQCLQALLVLTLVAIYHAGAQPDPYDDYDAEDDMYGLGGGDSPGPTPQLQQHINGIVDVDALTFDKVVFATPGRPVFAVFYDVAQPAEEQVGMSWTLEKVAKTMSDHLRLLLVKLDASAAEARILKQRFGITELPAHVLFESVDQQTQYVMDSKDSDAASKLEGWLLDQVGLSAAVEPLMPVVDNFMRESNTRADALQAAQEKVQLLQPFEARVGTWYLKVMKNIMKKGDGYLKTERKRLDRMLTEDANSMSREKAAEFKLRLNVVDVFLSRQPA